MQALTEAQRTSTEDRAEKRRRNNGEIAKIFSESTLISYLANMALMRRLTTAIIDGDTGQGDLAPPGCIGAAVVRKRVYDLRDLKADVLGFVGFTSVSYRFIFGFNGQIGQNSPS